MRFVKTPKPLRSSVTASRGVYRNARGNITHHERKSQTPIKFVGVDGEGITVNVVDAEGTCERVHRYVLFGVGDHQISKPTGLEWWEVFDHLYQFNKPGVGFVGFFLGYDFTQMFKTLREDRAWYLLTTEGRAKRRHRIPGKTPHPVEARTPTGSVWQFDVLGMKRLRLRPKRCDCPTPTCPCRQSPWMYVCDAGSYFQSSFLKAINPSGYSKGTEVVTADEYAIIKEGKERRSTAVLDDDMRLYNKLENAVLARVMSTLDVGLHGIGIHLSPSKWFGPGQAAQAWLRNEGVPTREMILHGVPAWFMEAARMSYFGGWFELFMHGHVPGTVHEYDINSAYPHIIASLPCLLHGTYAHGEGSPPADLSSDSLCLVYANVWAPSMPTGRRGQHIGTMLHRHPSGNILRPLATEGWFWWKELKAAEKAGLVKTLNVRGRQTLSRWVSYSPCPCPPPMRNVRSLYTKRLEVGKDTPLGKTAKLVYNSMYGKFAQSLGEPVFANPVYASLITSGCRTQILDAIASHPRGMSDVVMVATDAVYFLSPHPHLLCSSALGDWDTKAKRNLTLFKPGVYWDNATRERISSGQGASFKARGFKASDFAAALDQVDAEFNLWADIPDRALGGTWPTVEFTASFAMVSALQAIRRGKWNTAGAVSTGDRLVQNADPYTKRTGLYRVETPAGSLYRSEPHYGMADIGVGRPEWIASTPYDKRFGMEDPFSDEYKEQFGITEDGTVYDVLAWTLGDKL